MKRFVISNRFIDGSHFVVHFVVHYVVYFAFLLYVFCLMFVYL